MTAIFGAIIAVVKAIPIVDSWFQQFLAWYMLSHTSGTLSEVADAAAYSARAKTKEDRDAALKLWHSALSRTRIVS